jgi:hypothetical protein
MLYSYCTVLILYSYDTHTVLTILYAYCTRAVLILYSYYTHTILILYSYCTHTILTILYSYCIKPRTWRGSCESGHEQGRKRGQAGPLRYCTSYCIRYCTCVVLILYQVRYQTLYLCCTHTVPATVLDTEPDTVLILYSYAILIHCTHTQYANHTQVLSDIAASCCSPFCSYTIRIHHYTLYSYTVLHAPYAVLIRHAPCSIRRY